MIEDQRKTKEFIDNNREVFKLLAEIARQVDTVKGVDTLQEMKARQKALRIMSEWLTQLWGIAYDDLPEIEREDEIFRTITDPNVN